MGLRISSMLAPAMILLCGLAAVSNAQDAAKPATFTDGQKVEVREGDTWSKADIVKKEGRKYLIHYEGADASTDEWVTADRIRSMSDAKPADKPADKPAEKPATKPAVKPPVKPATKWETGDKIEVKWGGLWRQATITNRRDDWYLITYSPGSFREWVEPWRIRKPGSKEDDVGYATPNPTILRNIPAPPSEKPGPAPEPFGGRPTPRPATPNRTDGTEKPANEAAVPFKDDPAYKEPDWRFAADINLHTPPGEINLPPDPPTHAAANGNFPAITLKSNINNFFETVKSVCIPRSQRPLAFVTHVNAPPGKPVETRIERVDLAGAVSAGVYDVTPETVLMDVAPDGATALFRSDSFSIGKKDRLEIWTLAPPAPKRTLLFFPYGDADWAGRDVEWAAFTNPTHLLTLGRNGKFALWDVSNAMALYTAQIAPGCRPALSPGGKYVALQTESAILIIEALTGKARAEFSTDGFPNAKLAFSPSGRQLSAWSGNSARLWDLLSGQLLREFSVPISGSSISMPAEAYALIDGTYLIDFTRRILLWQYEVPRPAADIIAPPGRHWYTLKPGGKSIATLASTELPHAEALATAKSLNPDDLMLIRPGIKVALALNITATDQEKREITDAITRRLESNRITIDDSSPIRIVLTTEQGKSEEREYRKFGGGVEKVTVTPQISKIAVESEGKTAWTSQTSSGAGLFITLKQGQTIADAVAEQSKPNLIFFKSIRLPAYLAKPRDPAWHGSSKLTPRGVAP